MADDACRQRQRAPGSRHGVLCLRARFMEHGVMGRRVSEHHSAESRGSRGQRPGEALIVGGFSSLGQGRGGSYAHRTAKRHGTTRVAASLAVPVALGVTLGIILAVSSGPTKAHVTQRSTVSTSSGIASPAPSPRATGG